MTSQVFIRKSFELIEESIRRTIMSEFECRKGHLVSPSVGYCKICGGRAVRMDGMTARQLMEQEREEPEEENDDNR